MARTAATSTSDEYRLSERVLITRGDLFRASGGPYWKSADGERISLQSSGPFKFVRHCKRGRLEWIEALDRHGSFCVLHLAGRRRRIDASLVPRPYTVKKRLTKKR